MKKIILIFSILCSFVVQGQNSLGEVDNTQRIAIKPYYSLTKIDNKNGNLLLSKMNKLLAKGGLSSYYSRYIMWPSIEVGSTEATATAPVMYVTEADVTFYIADNITQTIFGQISYTVKGVDKKENKTLYKALKKIKSTDSESIEFLELTKSKIIEFYNSKCDFILKEAESMAERKEYDKAINSLISIPEECTDCFIKCQDAAVNIYKQKMENECMGLIAKAKTAKVKDNFDLAVSYLSTILPDVSCYEDAQSLLKEIEDEGMTMEEKREWDFKVKLHNDTINIEQQTIDAIKKIGVAYGENQRPTNINWISRY